MTTTVAWGILVTRCCNVTLLVNDVTFINAEIFGHCVTRANVLGDIEGSILSSQLIRSACQALLMNNRLSLCFFWWVEEALDRGTCCWTVSCVHSSFSCVFLFTCTPVVHSWCWCDAHPSSDSLHDCWLWFRDPLSCFRVCLRVTANVIGHHQSSHQTSEFKDEYNFQFDLANYNLWKI